MFGCFKLSAKDSFITCTNIYNLDTNFSISACYLPKIKTMFVYYVQVSNCCPAMVAWFAKASVAFSYIEVFSTNGGSNPSLGMVYRSSEYINIFSQFSLQDAGGLRLRYMPQRVSC